MKEYIQSEEKYKGFTLKIHRFCISDKTLTYHRECMIYLNDKCLGIGKTKKECKDLIDYGCYDRYVI